MMATDQLGATTVVGVMMATVQVEMEVAGATVTEMMIPVTGMTPLETMGVVAAVTTTAQVAMTPLGTTLAKMIAAVAPTAVTTPTTQKPEKIQTLVMGQRHRQLTMTIPEIQFPGLEYWP
jgi:hypothetical protein